MIDKILAYKKCFWFIEVLNLTNNVGCNVMYKYFCMDIEKPTFPKIYVINEQSTTSIFPRKSRFHVLNLIIIVKNLYYMVQTITRKNNSGSDIKNN